jgi:insecticidal toxin complex protein TccC
MEGITNNMLGLTFHHTDQAEEAGSEPVALAPHDPNQEAEGGEAQSGHISEESPSSNSPEANHALENTITSFQSLIRGQQARNHVNVSAVEDTGIVHVQVKGDSNTFERVGIDGLNTSTGPKELHYLRVPSEGFQGHVAGGDSIYYDKDEAENRGQGSQQELVSSNKPEAESHAYINGGYFNLNLTNRNMPKHTPIGSTRTSGGTPVPSLPIPNGHREDGEDYGSLTFNDGSRITSGPVLSTRGEETFPEEKLNDPKYQYHGSNKAEPGVLKHAQQPNPRSGISVPGSASPDDASRLAVGLARGKRGKQSPGFTMPEWSSTMARLDRMNRTPGTSLNLDGGGSSALGVVNSKGEKLVDERENKTRGASTIISYSSTPKTPSSDETVTHEGTRVEGKETKRTSEAKTTTKK